MCKNVILQILALCKIQIEIMKDLLLNDHLFIIYKRTHHHSLIMQFSSPISEKAIANPHSQL